jgi:hypothetical protein
VKLCAFYFYKLIGKLTAFLQLQEFSLLNLPVASYFLFFPRRSVFSSQLKSKLGNILANAAPLRIRKNVYLLYHTLIHHTLKPLVSKTRLYL